MLTGQVTAFAGRLSMVETRQSGAVGILSGVITAQTMAAGRPPVLKTEQSTSAGRATAFVGRLTVFETRQSTSVGRLAIPIGKVVTGVGKSAVVLPSRPLETPEGWFLKIKYTTTFQEFRNLPGAPFRINLCASASLR